MYVNGVGAKAALALQPLLIFCASLFEIVAYFCNKNFSMLSEIMVMQSISLPTIVLVE
jgi:hypothetical protein